MCLRFLGLPTLKDALKCGEGRALVEGYPVSQFASVVEKLNLESRFKTAHAPWRFVDLFVSGTDASGSHHSGR